jgi:hypothetical protein
LLGYEKKNKAQEEKDTNTASQAETEGKGIEEDL